MLTQSIISIALTILLATPAGDTRISDAAMKGDQLRVQTLLKQKVDVNAAQGDGTTALHWAAYRDDVQMARWLIQAGANVKAQTRLADMTPLHLAAVNGNAVMVELLLKAGADVSKPNSHGTTALMLAAASGKPEAVRLLLDYGADVNACDASHGQTALMFAAALNRGPAIKLLADRGANLNIVSAVTEVNPIKSAERAAAIPADAKLHNGNLLTSTGSDNKPNSPSNTQPNAPRDNQPSTPSDKQATRQANVATEEQGKSVTQVGGNTALHFAARDGQMQAVQALVEAGADVNQVSGVGAMSPLIQAIVIGHYDIAKYLLDHGAGPNLATKKEGLTPLYATLDSRFAPRAWYPSPSVEQEETSYLDLMKDLLALDAAPNARLGSKPWFRTFGDSSSPDPAGATAFWRAAQANDVAAMKLLVAAGANPTITTTHGSSPLQAAAGMLQDFQGANVVPEGRMDTIRYLVEDLGADVNARDDKGYSVLHGAAFIGRNDILAYLVAHGADVTVRANQISNGPSMQAAKPGDGDTVADMANGWVEKVLQYPETVNLLIKMGSAFSNRCFASVCVNPTRLDKSPKAPQN